MSWLEEITGEMVKNLPEDAFSDWTFGFADILSWISAPMVHLLPGACRAEAETARAFIGRAVAIAERDPRWNGPKRSRT